jgi:hypothetical protein
MITIVPAEVQIEHDYGDYIYGGTDWFRTKPSDEFMEKCCPIGLGIWAYNPFMAMVRAGIDKDAVAEILKDTRHQDDLYSGEAWMAFVPHVLLTLDPEAYTFEHGEAGYLKKMVTDTGWQRRMTYREYIEEGEMTIPGPLRGMMGSGYMSPGILPSDGSNSILHTYLLLSNGDYVMGFTWCWHNK